MRVCTPHECPVPSEVRKQSVLDLLELEFQMLMSHYVGDGTDPGSLQKQQVFLISESSLQYLATSPTASQHG